MIFWLRDKNPINIKVLIKAIKLENNFFEIERNIKKGLVLLNDELVLDFDKEADKGDVVKYRDTYIYVKVKKSQFVSDEKLVGIRHGNINRWQSTNDVSVLDTDIERISFRLHNLLFKKKLTISVAESCTGGMLQEVLTRNSGSSNYFYGGIVSYSIDSKKVLLKVKSDTLKKYGVVSEQTAKEMVLGVKEIFKTDIAVSITGIAGPTGGSKEKPVGTVHFAITIDSELYHKNLFLKGNRELIRKQTIIEILKYLERKIS